MALTRKMLKAMGIEDEKIDQIIEAHTETADALKEQRDSFKADAEKLATVQAELDKLKEDAAKNSGEDSTYKVKYEAIKEEFETYKNDIAAKETISKIREAYRSLLKSTGVAEKRIESVLKVTPLSELKLDEEGKLADEDKLKESIQTEWADFIAKDGKVGAEVATPPANEGNTFNDLSLADKMKFANEHPDDAAVREWLKK